MTAATLTDISSLNFVAKKDKKAKSVIIVINGMNHAVIGNTIVHLLFFILFIIYGKILKKRK